MTLRETHIRAGAVEVRSTEVRIDTRDMGVNDLRRLHSAIFYSTRNARIRKGVRNLTARGETQERAYLRAGMVWGLSGDQVRDIVSRQRRQVSNNYQNPSARAMTTRG